MLETFVTVCNILLNFLKHYANYPDIRYKKWVYDAIGKGITKMGLSASQARLLTLTTRLSDLELNAQQVTNSKLRLAAESKDASSKYTNALDNQKFSLLSGVNNSGAYTYSKMTYNNLTGLDSPLVGQYCVTDINGNVLVPKDIALSFESSSDLDGFLTILGAKKTVYPDGLDEARELSETTKAAYDAKVIEHQQDFNALEAYGKQYVEGYTSVGQWSYTRQVYNGTFTTNYSNDYARQVLSNYSFLNYYTDHEGETNYSSSGTPQIASLPRNCGGNESLVKSRLSSCLSEVTTDFSNAMRTVMQQSFGSGWEVASSKINEALASASSNAQAFYMNQFDSAYENRLSLDAFAALVVSGKNHICYSTEGRNDEVLLDMSQFFNTFLNYFDAACASLDGISGTDPNSYTSNITSTSSNRPLVAGGTGSSNSNGTTTVTYSSTNGGAISIINGGSAEQYNALLQAYQSSDVAASEQAYSDAEAAYYALEAKIYVSISQDAGYYTNIYNKMADGFVTIDSANASSEEWMESQITSCNLLLQKYTNGDWEGASWYANSDIMQTSVGSTDISEAESEYKAAMAEVKTKDSKYDLELKKIDTEHTAIQTEIDSVKKVVDKNIERTFKSFDA